jgi:glycosyltransferase involved in cell wall biosynthesis
MEKTTYLTLRILVVSQYFWPENFRINDLVQEFVRRGHIVTVLTGYPNYQSDKVYMDFRDSPNKYSIFSGATVCRVPLVARGKGSLRLALNYLSFMLCAAMLGPMRLRGQSFDVIFVFEPSPVTVGVPAVVLGKFKKTPVIFWVLDLWPETLSAVGVVRSRLLLDTIGWLVRFIYNRCELVLGQSKGFIGSIAKYCNDERKIRYFPSWAEEVYNHDVDLLAPEVPVHEGLFNVLFAGNIGEAQDFPAVLDAAEQLKDNSLIRWLIVGDGRMSDWVTEEVTRRGLEKCFLMLGRFPFERMPSFYAHADVLLVSLKANPVFSLTIPGKIQSYLLAGIPLVGMLNGEGANVICEAQAGLVCAAGDSNGLAQAVRKLCAMPKNERLILGRNGRAYAKQEFDRNTLMDRLESWFDEVSNRGRKTRAGSNY